MRGAIMYIEEKPGLAGPARIGRVTFSKTGMSVYYRGRTFASRGNGYKKSHVDEDTGLDMWLSRPRRDGQDTLYPAVVEIDDDAREEYWTAIRRRPDLVAETHYRSEGKYSRRRARGVLRREPTPAVARRRIPAAPFDLGVEVHDAGLVDAVVGPRRELTLIMEPLRDARLSVRLGGIQNFDAVRDFISSLPQVKQARGDYLARVDQLGYDSTKQSTPRSRHLVLELDPGGEVRVHATNVIVTRLDA